MHRRLNIGILAHIDAGKTTVTEHLLHLGGVIRRPGSVDSGTTVTDWMVDEQERGITITSAASTFRWRDSELTLVDTPGHVDFTIEVERTLRVLDGVVLVISGPDGVQAQTETVWAQKTGARLPAICFINKLDGADFDVSALLVQIAERLHTTPVALQVARRRDNGWTLQEVFDAPGAGAEGTGVGLTRLSWGDDENEATDPSEEDEVADGDEADELDEVLRLEALDHLINAVASSDDEYAELILGGGTPTRARHLAALRRAIAEHRVLPVLFGAARHGLGLDRLADAIVELLPSAEDRVVEVFRAQDAGEIVPDGHHRALADNDQTCVYVFKTEPRRGGVRLAFVRVFSGAIATGDVLVRSPDGATYRPVDLVRVIGRDYEAIPRFEAGEIGALLFGPDDPFPRTGDTLGLVALPFTIERVHPPEPVLEIAVEASDSESHSRMIAGLAAMCEDDPSLHLSTDRETGRALIAGMGELHLAIAIERIKRDLGLAITTGQPQIRRRFMLTLEGRGEATVNHPAGRARVRIVVEVRPNPSLELSATSLDRADLRGAVMSGLEAAAGVDGTGPHPLIDGAIEAIEIELHGTDIVPIMLRDAAEWAALRALDASILRPAEPWVRLVVIAPDAAIGRLVGDLARRRARVKGSESRGPVQVLTAEVPLSDLIGFATDLRSLTAGRGQFSLVPLGYRAIDG